jgi:hypothetical protein
MRGLSRVLVEEFGQWLLVSGPHLQHGVVVRSRPSVGPAEEDDVDPKGFRPTQVADQTGDTHGGRSRQWRLDSVRLGQVKTLGVHGQAYVPQGLREGGAFVEHGREIGAVTQV